MAVDVELALVGEIGSGGTMAQRRAIRSSSSNTHATVPSRKGLFMVYEQTVGAHFEPLEGERWAHEVAAEPLEALAIATVDADLRVHVEARDLGDRLVGAGAS